MTIRIGVIGTGVMGANHVRVLSDLKDRCHLVGVFDVDEKKAASIAAAFEIPAYTTFHDLLNTIDAAVIAVPISEHYEVSRMCIERGIHVLIEKPMTETIEEAEKLKELGKDKSVKVQVGHIELFNPAIKVLKRILNHEEIIAIHIQRLSPYSDRWRNVDVITDMMIHDLYILNYLFESKPQVCSSFGRVIHNKLNHVVATLQFKDGLIATLTGSQVTEEKVRTIQVITKKAYIFVDLMDRKILISRSTNFFISNHQQADYKQQNIVEKVIVPASEPLREELQHFIDAIAKDLNPSVSIDEGIEALQMVDLVKSFHS